MGFNSAFKELKPRLFLPFLSLRLFLHFFKDGRPGVDPGGIESSEYYISVSREAGCSRQATHVFLCHTVLLLCAACCPLMRPGDNGR